MAGLTRWVGRGRAHGDVAIDRHPGSYVLVIDRGTDLGEPVVELLRRRGYDVEESVARNAGIAAMRECTPSLVILDMGAGSAAEEREILIEMQKDPTLAGVPVCVVAAEPVHLGPAVIVISRPVSAPELRQVVADYCAPIGRDDR